MTKETHLAAVAAIQFALSNPEGMEFLRLWNEGEFDTLRREWPEAPSEVYVGADPLAQQPAAPSGAVNVIGMPEFDGLLDHIYEHGTTSEGVIERANAFARAVIARYAPPESYALVSVELLRAWGKLDELRECCQYPKHATPQPTAHPAITHCDNCGCDWLDNGLNPVGCPYCKKPDEEKRGPLAHSRNVIRQSLHWHGIPVHVTGTVTTSPGNWSLIDAALATQHREPTT